MAFTALYENSATISTTEYSLPNNTTYSAGSVKAVSGVFQVFIDLSSLAAGDQYDLRVKEKVQSAGTVRDIFVASYVGVQASPHTVLPSLLLMYGWDVTLKRIAGSDKTIAWSIRQVS